ncbi:aspartate carbamoyltransferase regulatory subunit [Serpentinicella alkaliphila]|uniref:Aspartate carbamoyltransferase regulatory subunit n=1 Tax=Serpentinicella alkaliphila TaxID=1734049 RepID=A0A4R2TME8_9FIRM|nr:aspartate carbamoyltransferase regulatory subunit [Serpentinicella alkaliphila]QUH24713.1 aspartate carbamoyltransferase regulatory subunit [Serpentinicella alkaliphila]TCQ03702.1 aspartate carbamoyltransferase regulatory subunit [Serpentinicella alkaliphila]
MLKVTSIERGIVIDHISSGKGLKIFQKLSLDKLNTPVVLLMNVQSKELGKKDIIKIQDFIDLDLRILGLIDPNITINIIEKDQIVEKKKVELPQKVKGLFQCKNPRCITSIDTYVEPEFTLAKNSRRKYKCSYCEELTEYKL